MLDILLFSPTASIINDIWCYANTTIVKHKLFAGQRKWFFWSGFLDILLLALFFRWSVRVLNLQRKKAVCLFLLLFLYMFFLFLSIEYLRVRQSDKRSASICLCFLFLKFSFFLLFLVILMPPGQIQNEKWKFFWISRHKIQWKGKTGKSWA